MSIVQVWRAESLDCRAGSSWRVVILGKMTTSTLQRYQKWNRRVEKGNASL
jgi:hypothetical protein